jgi:hypothetical protein
LTGAEPTRIAMWQQMGKLNKQALIVDRCGSGYESLNAQFVNLSQNSLILLL